MQRLLHVLEKKSDMSAGDLSAEAFVGLSTLACGGYIKKLKAQRWVFISGWRQVNGRFSTPLYSAGDSEDVARPKVDDSCRDAPGMWTILATLEWLGPLTYRDIADHSGLSPNTVKNSGYLSALIVQRHIHIGGWKRSPNGPMQPIYHAGTGEEAPRPDAVSGAEISRNSRTRKRIRKQGTEWMMLMATLRA